MGGVLWPFADRLHPDGNVQHVYPCYGREHDTDGGECWCSPERRPVELDGEVIGTLVIHREEN